MIYKIKGFFPLNVIGGKDSYVIRERLFRIKIELCSFNVRVNYVIKFHIDIDSMKKRPYRLCVIQ